MTYQWAVTRMMVLPEESGQEDVVISANYIVTGVDGSYTASVELNQSFTYTGGAFTPYSELTEDQVVGWIKSSLGENGIQSIEMNINGQIETEKNPPLTPETLPLPWTP